MKSKQKKQSSRPREGGVRQTEEERAQKRPTKMKSGDLDVSDQEPDSDELQEYPPMPETSDDEDGVPWKPATVPISDKKLFSEGFMALEIVPGKDVNVVRNGGEVILNFKKPKRARGASEESSEPKKKKKKEEEVMTMTKATKKGTPPAHRDSDAPEAEEPSGDAAEAAAPRVPVDREYTCTLCQVTTSKVCMDLHVKGKKHLNRLADRLQKGQPVDEDHLVVCKSLEDSSSTGNKAQKKSATAPAFTCEICDVSFPIQGQLDAHLTGKKYSFLRSHCSQTQGTIASRRQGPVDREVLVVWLLSTAREEKIKKSRLEEIQSMRGSDEKEFTTGVQWGELGLSPELASRLVACNFNSPTLIQHMVISSSLNSHVNILAAAQTGSGKSLAFLLPILEHLHRNPESKLIALIIVPTRELGKQLHNLFCALDPERRFFCSTLIGGENEQKQIRLLKKCPQVLIGTPGRVHYFIKEDPTLLPFSNLRFMILDEADRLIAPNSFLDLPKIIQFIIAEESRANFTERETMLFSATLTMSNTGREKGKQHINFLQKIIDSLNFSSAPKVIDLSREQGVNKVTTELTLPEGLSMYNIVCEGDEEKQLTLYSLFLSNPGKYLVFVNTIESIKYISSLFNSLNIKAYPIHAHLQQRQRIKNLERFKREPESILVATDVAARGVDIPNVTCVVQYHIPQSPELFVHRMGRTARGAKDGMGVCLLAQMEYDRMKLIEENLLHRKLPRYPLDVNSIKPLRNRVRLAQKICQLELQISKSEAKKGYTSKLAQDLDVELSDEENPAETSENEFQKKRLRKGLEAARRQLDHLLKETVIPKGISRSFFTSNTPGFIQNMIEGSSSSKKK